MTAARRRHRQADVSGAPRYRAYRQFAGAGPTRPGKSQGRQGGVYSSECGARLRNRATPLPTPGNWGLLNEAAV